MLSPINLPSSQIILYCSFAMGMLFPPILCSYDMEAFENEDSTLGPDILFSTKQFLKKKNTLPPIPPNGDHPVNVGIEIHVESIRDIAGDATLDLYMIEDWTDYRETKKFRRKLEGNTESAKKTSTNSTEDEIVKLSGKGTVNYCWIPDTYFILARSIYYSPSSQSLQVNTTSGDVYLDRKIRIVTPCTPDVWLFPFDVTNCTILISSYGYHEDELKLFWRETEGANGRNITGISFPFEYEPLSEMGFCMISMEATSFSAQYDTVNFTILKGVIGLKRLYSVYIYQIYIPAALLVVLSWVSFWINRNATPARASVGVTTVLTMLTLATQSQQNMEKHITLETSLLDVYIWVSFSFVIAAMLEFAVSDFFNDKRVRAKNKHKPLKPQIYENHNNNALSDKLEPAAARPLLQESSQEKTLISIDKTARIIFPAVFLIFNIIYCTYVFIKAPVQQQDGSNSC